MRAVTVNMGDRTWGAFDVGGGDLQLLQVPDAVAALRTSTPLMETTVARSEVELAPVVPYPRKILCVGRNYTEHARELKRDIPEHPTLFARFASSLVGPYADIVAPGVSDQLDWEGELAVVIGHCIREANESQARAAILGFTVFNDVSVRDWQWRTSQWLQGKTFDSTGPLGPAIVTLDELADPDDLRLTVDLDGTRVQDARTSQMIFGPAKIVSYVSQFCTLDVGDVIATGTPAGVGAARDPQIFLRPGQTVTTTIEGVGTCVNRVIRSTPTERPH